MNSFPSWLALVSGAAGLAHQLLWTRRLVDGLGANADTFSKVVGTFFLGLSLGAWAASAPGAKGTNFWRRVALAEGAVALCAIPVLFVTPMVDALPAKLTEGRWLKLALPLLLVAPPAVAMGLVVPWMVRAMAARPGVQPRHAVWLYAMNTLGGILGLGWIVLSALPSVGLTGASVTAIALNLLVAAGAWALGSGKVRRGTRPTHHAPAPDEPGIPASVAPEPGAAGETAVPAKLGYAMAFASGFLIVGFEVVLQHQFAQIAINSLFSNALVLAVVLASLAAAAALLPPVARWIGDDGRLVGAAVLAAAVLCALEPFVLTFLRGGLEIFAYELPPLPYISRVVGLGLLVAGPALLAAGLVFPLLLRRAARDADARGVGLLFCWNGLGGWLGAETAQGWLAPAFGLWLSVTLLAAGYVACGLMWSWRRATGATAVVAAPVLALVVGSGWAARALPQATVAPTERLAALAVGREGVVATLECGPGDWRMLFNNSYTLGGSKAQFNQERQGLLPLLLHGHARTAATLGVATGGSVAGAALCPGVEHLEAIELSPLVLRYAEQFFSPFNRDVFQNPRVRFVQEDARWVMAGRGAAYDVVVGDLFLPWRTGEARLFTLEHFRNVRRALKPDGLFCQWLPLFQLTQVQFDAIGRTFREVFPEAFLVRGDFYSELPIVGLVGGRDFGQIAWPEIRRLCDRLRAEGATADPLVRHVEGVAMMVLGPLAAPGPGPVNTLANAWLEWDAGRNILGLRAPWFMGVPWAEFARNGHRAGYLFVPRELQAAHDAGQFFLTLEIASRLNLPVLEDLTSQMAVRTPVALRTDAGADWRQWPMRIKPAFGGPPASP